MLFSSSSNQKGRMISMGMMDDAIKETVKEKGFKKTDIQKLAARNKQVGGNHYKDCKIQPIDYIMENNLTFCEGNALKYITRHRRKGDVQGIYTKQYTI